MQRHLVEEEDELARRTLYLERRALSPPWFCRQAESLPLHRIAVHREVRDLLRPAVFENHEVVFRQSFDRLAGAIGDHDVEIVQAHFERFDVRLLRDDLKEQKCCSNGFHVVSGPRADCGGGAISL
jgi:hypothetical protein